MEITCKHTETEKRFVDYYFTEELFTLFCKSCNKSITNFKSN